MPDFNQRLTRRRKIKMSDINIISNLINEIPNLIKNKVTLSDSSFIAWQTNVERFLSRVYGDKSYEFKKFNEINYDIDIISLATSSFESDEMYLQRTNKMAQESCRIGLLQAESLLNIFKKIL